MGAIITLTTDFGMRDGYVAAMKGVILGINPAATLVDVCHTVKPQNVNEAAFVINTVYKVFPQRTVHLIVVDPGVGSNRRAVIVRTPLADFVAPDNGVLSYVIDEFSRAISARSQAELGKDIQAYSITRPEFWRQPVSPTFHGRDIFAPVAARLSLSEPPESFGERVTSLTVIPLSKSHKNGSGTTAGHVIHLDGFGNLITNIKDSDLPQKRDNLSIQVGGKLIHGVNRTYSERSGLLALVGSRGYMEISLQNGSAGDFLGVGVGDQVKVIMQEQK